MSKSALAALALGGLFVACDGTPPGVANRVVVGAWAGGDGGLIADHQSITASPVDRGIMHPARFSGAIVGGGMVLTVTLTDTAVTVGPIALVHGAEPQMHVCPICRRPGKRMAK